MPVITNDSGVNELMAAIVLQNTQDYIKSGRWLRENPVRRNPKTGEYTEGYMRHVRAFEGAQSFFESKFFLEFVNGNEDAKINYINRLNKSVDLPKQIPLEVVVNAYSAFKKDMAKLSYEEKERIFFKETKLRPTKSKTIKVDTFYLNSHCKMLTDSIANCFLKF